MRTSTPYRPGFDRSPVLLTGRGDVLESLTEALEVARRTAAEEHGWAGVGVQVSPGWSVVT